MRIPRLLATVLLLLVVAGLAAPEQAVAAASKESPRMKVLTLAADLAKLRSKIAYLEFSILLKTQELNSKDRDIQWQRRMMSYRIATLESEIASLQSKGSVAAGEQTDKANDRVIELEIQIVKLKKDMDKRASDAKKQVQELNATLERLEKTKAEEERRVQKTQHALEVAKVHGAWLPPWLATHAARSVELMSSQWNEHGKPAFNSLLQKASEKSVQATEWAKPHMETAKEEAKKLSKSCIDQVAKASKPHVEKLKTTLNPYTEEAGQAYENFRAWCSDLDGNLERAFLRFYLELHEVAPMAANFLHEFYLELKGVPRVPLLAEQAQRRR